MGRREKCTWYECNFPIEKVHQNSTVDLFSMYIFFQESNEQSLTTFHAKYFLVRFEKEICFLNLYAGW